MASQELLVWNGIDGSPSSLSNPLLTFGDGTAHPYIPWREMFMGVMGTVAGAVLVIRARAPQLLETDSH